MMDARITVTFIARNICEPQDLTDTGMTLDAMVRDLIGSEGLIGIANEEEIVSVEELKAPRPCTPASGEEGKSRIECASCKKAPTDDPNLALHRMNVKGVPGVFLCQWCIPTTPKAPRP